MEGATHKGQDHKRNFSLGQIQEQIQGVWVRHHDS